jgi:hypothetical protein
MRRSYIKHRAKLISVQAFRFANRFPEPILPKTAAKAWLKLRMVGLSQMQGASPRDAEALPRRSNYTRV